MRHRAISFLPSARLHPLPCPQIHTAEYTQDCRFMGKRLREISRFFVAPRRELAPAVRARPPTPFSINTSTSVLMDQSLTAKNMFRESVGIKKAQSFKSAAWKSLWCDSTCLPSSPHLSRNRSLFAAYRGRGRQVVNLARSERRAERCRAVQGLCL